MDERDLLQKIYEKSEELAKCKAALHFLQHLFEEEDDKRLLLDEKQFRMIMDIAGIKVEKEIQLFCDNCSDVAYES